MPRYFFDLLGDREEMDQVGIEFPNEAAARQEAILRTLNGKSFRLQTYSGFKCISVRDEKGKVIWEVRIHHAKDRD